MAQQSATFDETAHLGAGYTQARFGDFHLNPEHPPLAKWVAGLSSTSMVETNSSDILGHQRDIVDSDDPTKTSDTSAANSVPWMGRR
jgi:hypothetical protein